MIKREGGKEREREREREGEGKRERERKRERSIREKRREIRWKGRNVKDVYMPPKQFFGVKNHLCST